MSGEPVSAIATLNVQKKDKNIAKWSDLLAQLAESQDRSIFVELYQHFAPKVKSYILRLGLVESTADDLTQETMLSVWRKAHMYDRSKAAASTWIFTLARNQSIDWMRKQRYPEHSVEDVVAELPVEEPKGDQAVTAGKLQKSILSLPEAQAQVIYMSYFEGRSHSEIAERLNLPLGSVKSRIRLASEKLKLMWSDGE
ncbi:MAG: sigma-70 family RNA polymerase sigma factor [Pontibacterium sp.]